MRLQACPVQDPMLVGAAGAFPASRGSFRSTRNLPGRGPPGRYTWLTSTVGPQGVGARSAYRRVPPGILRVIGPFGGPSGASGWPSATLAPPGSFGTPRDPSGIPRWPSETFGVPRTLRVPFGGPRVPFGGLRLQGPSGLLGMSGALSVLLFARSWGPVGRPYDKPLAVEVLLRHG